jgi:hypothetical protein
MLVVIGIVVVVGWLVGVSFSVVPGFDSPDFQIYPYFMRVFAIFCNLLLIIDNDVCIIQANNQQKTNFKLKFNLKRAPAPALPRLGT